MYMYKTLRTDHYDSVLKNKLRTLGHQHDYQTRSGSDLLIPRFSRERSKADIYYIGVRLWNTIPESIKNLNTVSKFKSGIKNLYLEALNSRF